MFTLKFLSCILPPRLPSFSQPLHNSSLAKHPILRRCAAHLFDRGAVMEPKLEDPNIFISLSRDGQSRSIDHRDLHTLPHRPSKKTLPLLPSKPHHKKNYPLPPPSRTTRSRGPSSHPNPATIQNHALTRDSFRSPIDDH